MMKIVFVLIFVASCYCKQKKDTNNTILNVEQPSIVVGSNYKPHSTSRPKSKGKDTTTAAPAVAINNTKCTTRSAGWLSPNSLALQATIAEGQKSGSLDVTNPGLACKHVGLKVIACDKDLEPLVKISKDMNIIEIFRNGNNTEEIMVDVILRCNEPLNFWTRKIIQKKIGENNLIDSSNNDTYERKFKPIPGLDINKLR